MKRNRVSITERKATGPKQNQTSSQRNAAVSNPKVMKNNSSVNMINTRSVKEHKAKEKAEEEPIVPARETDLETPDQSIDGVEKKDDRVSTNDKCRITRKKDDRILTN